MLHKNRRWSIADAEDALDLAIKLTQYCWCCCTGFRLEGWLFLNDSTSPDGAGEWGIVRQRDGVQVESVTFGWLNVVKAEGYVRRVLAGEFKEAYSQVDLSKVEDAKAHETCAHCA